MNQLQPPRWCYEIPSVPGWYWWQPDPVADPRIVEFLQMPSGQWGWLGHTVGGGRLSVMYYGPDAVPGRWLGPIEPPMAHEAWRPERSERPHTDSMLVPGDRGCHECMLQGRESDLIQRGTRLVSIPGRFGKVWLCENHAEWPMYRSYIESQKV